MKIIFSNHALLKMRQREIPAEFVREAVLVADKIVARGPSREERYRRFGSRYLKVVVAVGSSVVVVVTTHWVRNSRV